MERIALYSRVSTKEQKTDVQADILRRYARRRGAEAVEFIDHGVSGARANRPELDKMMASLRRREFSSVIITKLDRIGRSVQHLSNLGAEFRALNVDLVVLDQAIDTSTPVGRMMFTALGMVAEFERDLMAERISQGVKAARQRGVKFGRPPALDRKGRDRARRLRENGATIRAIAKQLDVGIGTVSRVLSNS